MRLLATITIQLHLGKNHKVTPEKLLPFPWDKADQRKAAGKDKVRKLTKEQQRKRMEELVKKLGDDLI